jgi:hypothetical protein
VKPEVHGMRVYVVVSISITRVVAAAAAAAAAADVIVAVMKRAGSHPTLWG